MNILKDRFGFKIPTQWIKAEHFYQFDAYYQPIVDKQCNDWDQLLSEHGHQLPALSPQLKQYVRNGIPNELRGKVWMHYSGAYNKLNTNPELYDSLVNTATNLGELNEYAEIIRRDLHRTFPDNSEFSCDTANVNGSVLMIPETNSKLQSLQNVLLAFSIYSPHIGYCQSLNYLVGFFLLFLKEEKEAFWMLVITINDYFPEKMYDVTMDGANLDQTVLLMYIHEKMPSVWDKISNGKSFWEIEKDGLPPINLVTSHWFLTLFINILPIETVLRIWDCFFVEGYSVIFRVALSLIKMNEERIKDLKDPIEIFQVLQNMPRRLIDCHNFMDYVFSDNNIFNDITSEQIEYRRSIIQNKHLQKQQKNVY
ncbi:TBC-domain-containing protein [Backusella circina FSU 941]|nr:TBC-domain-containing protein [Backusella circina FSU 941]